MSFSFLAPLALGLSALVALPILAHLTRQRPTDRVPYGAMLLVQRLVKRLRRRRQLKDVLLLALRAAAVLLVVLAAAGPRFSWIGDVPDFAGSGRVVLVVDTSMSMALVDGGSSLLQRAKAEARSRVAAMPDGVKYGLVAYDAVARPLTQELTDDEARILAAIDGLEPTIDRGDLRGALLEARRQLGGEPGEVLLFTDEAGPTMIPDAQEELQRLVETGSAVLPVPIHAEPPRNVTVSAAAWSDGLEGGQVTFRVTNYGPKRLEVSCEVALPDGKQIPVFVEAPPTGEAEAKVTVPREARGGVGRVACQDPDLGLDDARWFHLPHVGASRVLVVDGDPGDTPTRSEVYFLERALAPWGGGRAAVMPDIVSPKGIAGGIDADTYRVLFLANVSDPQQIAGAVREFVRRGGSLFVSVGDNVTAERYDAAFGPLLPAPFRRTQAIADRMEEPVPLELPDVGLPLFEPFERAGRGSFTKIGAWRVVTLEPYTDGGDVTTLLRYQGGVPALVERKIGKGRVLVWTSSIDLGWSNLPLQAAFMPLMLRVVDYLGGGGADAEVRLDARVGDRVVVPLEEGVLDVSVVGPGGDPVKSRLEGSSVVFVPEQPGRYEVGLANGPPIAWVAVNVDPEESDVRRTHSVAKVEAKMDPELFTRHRDLGGPAMTAALGLLVASALLAPFVRGRAE